MVGRRSVLKAGFGLCSCAACGVFDAVANTARAETPARIQGPGYDLRFIGAQRETVIQGKLAAALDLRTLGKTLHLYAVGPIEQLRGEITIVDSRPSLARVGPDGAVRVAESFETGAPFLVWAEIPAWQTMPIPVEVRSFTDLEAFVPRAAASAGLDPQQPLPFLIRGQQNLIEFHVLNRIGDAPHGMETHKMIQVVFELAQAEAILVGFHSAAHRGVFTPMDSAMHIHFQTADNSKSGHIQNLALGKDLLLAFPKE